MPPKKVAPPPSVTGDEGTPSKQEITVRDGINIEVVHFMQAKFEVVYCPVPSPIHAQHDLLLIASFPAIMTNFKAGLESAKEHCDETCERCIASEHPNPGKCYVSNDEERDGLCELYC